MDYAVNPILDLLVHNFYLLLNPFFSSYMLNTIVDRPHESSLGCLKLRPYNSTNVAPLAVTVSRDRKFKLWTLIDDTDIYSKFELLTGAILQ